MKLEDWKQSRLVYSTDASKPARCQKCGQATCRCEKAPASGAAAARGKQKVLVKLDRKARRGKAVTLVEGIGGTAAEIEALARQLKTACGSGGTVKEGRIEIQGEHREKVLQILTDLGYRPKASGG